jgi:beta-aspartyl-peptidase (threonine type)
MMRFLATRAVCDRIAAGFSAQQAVDAVVAEMAASLGTDVGIIALDGNGGIGVAHATPDMPHGLASWYQDGITARLRVAAGSLKLG